MSKRVTVKIELIYDERGAGFAGLLPDELWKAGRDDFYELLEDYVSGDIMDYLQSTELRDWATIVVEEVENV